MLLPSPLRRRSARQISRLRSPDVRGDCCSQPTFLFVCCAATLTRSGGWVCNPPRLQWSGLLRHPAISHVRLELCS